MPTKEITELRKSGKLEDALALAKAEYNADSSNVWTKRNLSWVYYEYLKLNNTPATFDKFCDYLETIVSLQLPKEDKIFFDSIGRLITKMGNALLKEKNQKIDRFDRLLHFTKEFHFTIPSDVYSFLFQMFHKVYKETYKYIEFADWWNLENFRPEDYKADTMPNGKTFMALAEQAYIAYAKQLLPVQIPMYSGNQKMMGTSAINKEKINDFLLKLDEIEKKYPEYQYPAYYKAKLLLALGDKDNILSVLLPFAKKKRNDFWVWDIIGDTFDDNDERQFACYCKGLLCPAPEKMTIALRTKIIPFFIEKKMWNEAKTEIDKVIGIRQSNNWKISQSLASYKDTEWYKQAVRNKDNKQVYSEYSPIAESILFSDISEETIIVDFVNKDKKMLNFITSDKKIGFFKYDRFLKEVSIGDVFKVRFLKKEANGQCQIATIQKCEDNEQQSSFIKCFQGVVRIIEGSNLGFIEDVFISPAMCNKHKLLNGNLIEGKAIQSFNAKKNEWGWKAYEITES